MDLLRLLKQLDYTQWQRQEPTIPNKPILTRFQLQKMTVPRGDFEARSSGSTGIPVVVQKTKLSQLWWIATNIREAVWFKRDWKLPIAAIRANLHTPATYPSWGPGFELIGGSGPLYGHPVAGDLNAWLHKVNPAYLSVYPSVLETLDLAPLTNLRGIRTTGETLLRRHPLVADTYSSEEVGTIAIQCPDSVDAYHVMENIIVEILDNHNQSAASGRVVVTDLTSRYLHRYDIGDYAELGTCHCGRGLQTLRRILGRRRNMATMPDGTKVWPRIGSHEFRSVAPIRRYQAIQKTRTEIELRLIVDRQLTTVEQDAVVALVRKWMGYPFDVTLVYVEGFPSAKFEEFVCAVS